MEALWISAATVAVAEFGDKTQLLAILLAARFRRPVPILLGVLTATILNHAAAAWLGVLAARWLTPDMLALLAGAAFLGVAIWALFPDKVDQAAVAAPGGYGVFGSTLALFFLAEIGDKTQIATTLLAARFDNMAMVAVGTTLGMMATNAPAVLMGERILQRVSAVTMRRAAAAIFAVMGAMALAQLL